jgi:hypothetical protein
VSSLGIASVIFACILVATLLGMVLQRVLPIHHLTKNSKEAVKSGLALIATLSALVLGLLVATTKGTYDAQSAAVKEMAANLALLDRVLERYGPETKDIRALLPKVTRGLLAHMWPADDGPPADQSLAEARAAGEAMFDKIAALQPKTDAQRMMQSRALELTIGLAQTRQRLLAQKESSIPVPFLVVLGFWLSVLFCSYGLLAPRNLTVCLVLIVCMISVAGALFLVLEMDRPFDGIIRVPSAPMREVLSRLGG